MKNRVASLWTKIIIFSGLATFLFLAGLMTQKLESAEVVDRIVAIVNEDIIRLSDLNRHFEPIEHQIRAQQRFSPHETEKALYEARRQLIDDLIDEKLADQVIKETGIRVSESELDATIEQLKATNRLTQEDFIMALQSRGLTLEAYRENLRQQLLRNKLINQQVKSRIVITEDDIRDHRKANPGKYGLKGKYHLKNIFMSYQQGKVQTRHKMETVLEALEKGADFSTMAREYSMAPNAEEGGELGVFVLEDLSAHLQPVMADLTPGEFTGIIETDLGFQIFFLEDIKEPEKQDIEAVKQRIEQELYEQKTEEKFDEWIRSLRKSAHIRIIL